MQRVSLVSAAIIHARLVGKRCNKRGPGIYASAGSCIAPRRGRGIRLIILIAPSTPFLCARQASSSRRSLARALPSRARLTLCHSRLFALITRRECGAIRAYVYDVRVSSHKRWNTRDIREVHYFISLSASRYDAKKFFPRIARSYVKGIDR